MSYASLKLLRVLFACVLAMSSPVDASLGVLDYVQRRSNVCNQWCSDQLHGLSQGGSNADVVIVDSYLKNITGVDWATAYDAIVKDAEVEPLNWGFEGRGGLTSWKLLNYIPTDDFDPYGVGPMTRSISRTVEYAYNDFCIAEMAKGLKKSIRL
jgi:putative alpha-1,2-mannosidase